MRRSVHETINYGTSFYYNPGDCNSNNTNESLFWVQNIQLVYEKL